MRCKGYRRRGKKITKVRCRSVIADGDYCRFHKDQDVGYSVEDEDVDSVEDEDVGYSVEDEDVDSVEDEDVDSVEDEDVDSVEDEDVGYEDVNYSVGDRWGHKLSSEEEDSDTPSIKQNAERISEIEKRQKSQGKQIKQNAERISEIEKKQKSQGKQIRLLFVKNAQLENKISDVM
jgi:hypothetical protein